VAAEAVLEPYGAVADAAWTDHPRAKEDEVVAAVRVGHSSPAVRGTTSVVTVRVEAEAMGAAVLGPSFA
jgi:hypothetical protein